MRTAEWKAGALYDLEHTDMSLEDIGRKYNRSPYTVKQLQTRHKIKRALLSNARGPKPLASGEPLSPAHRRIGVKITLFRGHKSQQALASELGMSYYRLARMEVGHHDFTLTELQQLSKDLDLEISEIMAPPQEVLGKIKGKEWL